MQWMPLSSSSVLARSQSVRPVITCSILLFFFFFQAEDGIRDLTVTGVQTCALPICFDDAKGEDVREMGVFFGTQVATDVPPRSEERRVGKECRSRWSPYH